MGARRLILPGKILDNDWLTTKSARTKKMRDDKRGAWKRKAGSFILLHKRDAWLLLYHKKHQSDRAVCTVRYVKEPLPIIGVVHSR